MLSETELEIIDGLFSICKVNDFNQVDIFREYTFTATTGEEKSLICLTENIPKNTLEISNNWRAIKIRGILDFSLIGILSKILNILADSKIGIAAVSTFNTDYIFVKESNLNKAIKILAAAGYKIIYKQI